MVGFAALSDGITASIGPSTAVHAAESAAALIGIILALVIGVIGLVSSASA